jgi:hypothetical protein
VRPRKPKPGQAGGRIVEMLDQHRLQPLESGAAGRLAIAGDIEKGSPLVDADLVDGWEWQAQQNRTPPV